MELWFTSAGFHGGFEQKILDEVRNHLSWKRLMVSNLSRVENQQALWEDRLLQWKEIMK